MITAFEPTGYGACLLPEALHLQGGQPGMDGELRKGCKDGVAGRINLRLTELFITPADSFGTSEHH